jgi:hypothetical protein
MLFCLTCLTLIAACGPGGSDKYTVSGTVTASGAPLAGVAVTLSGSESSTTTTDANGNYQFKVSDGSYTLTASLSGYGFTPATVAATVSKASVGGKNFTTVTPTINLPRTGQTASYAAGDDGNLRRGVAWPTTRFTNNTNGTITDNLTGLVWLRNADCFNTQDWATALTDANALANGTCGLIDGSIAGAWRLPNAVELESLLDIALTGPALPSGHPFINVQSNRYWSSSTDAATNASAWYADMNSGAVGSNDKAAGTYYVWPVRGGL